ncbi:MAG: amidohydrolase family protein [Candidatus Binataceae bacterium]|jgi:predicted TIM-barrel fold metal-dependent hydrolase
MDAARQSKSAAIRARLNHPIIDSDGHQMEMGPLYLDYLKAVAGSVVADRSRGTFLDTFFDPRWREFSVAERHERRSLRPTWWGCPARNTRDLATALLPRLFHERLDEMGLDLSVVYPTLGLLAVEIGDEELRRAGCRALNRMKADMFAGLTDRLLPVATIPMHTPSEAITELEYAVGELGLRAVMMAGYVRRPVAAAVRISPEAARYTYWMDTYGLDSEYDYDSVWAKCVELKVSPTFHSVGYGWGSRATPSSYLHNHLGNFASSGDAICRGLLLGGVPKRFPGLTFAFMEGGVAWARNLYCDLVSHWDKRNREALENYNTARADDAVFIELARRYGPSQIRERGGEMLAAHRALMDRGADPAILDEWEPSGITSARDIAGIFSRQFYFGCEGDDPMNALASGVKGSPFGTRLHALYGSDLGHWDVPQMDEAAEEAHELVGRGVITEEDFRSMVFLDPVRFWTSANPDFFKGTVVETAAASVIKQV